MVLGRPLLGVLRPIPLGVGVIPDFLYIKNTCIYTDTYVYCPLQCTACTRPCFETQPPSDAMVAMSMGLRLSSKHLDVRFGNSGKRWSKLAKALQKKQTRYLRGYTCTRIQYQATMVFTGHTAGLVQQNETECWTYRNLEQSQAAFHMHVLCSGSPGQPTLATLESGQLSFL